MGWLIAAVDPVTDILGPVGAVSVTGGGIWFVFRLVIRFQKDFSDRYRKELDEQGAELKKCKQAWERCQRNELRMARLLITSGVDPHTVFPDDDPPISL